MVGEELFFSAKITLKQCGFDTIIVLWVGDALIYIKKLENDKSVDVKKKLKDPNMMGDQIQTMMEINEKLKK